MAEMIWFQKLLLREKVERDQQILECKVNFDFINIRPESMVGDVLSKTKFFKGSNTAAVVCDEMLFIDECKFVIGYIHEEMSFPSNKIGAVGR